MSDATLFLGRPARLDGVLGPIVRVLAWVMGGAGVLLLLFFQAWWWLPVPLLMSILVVEWGFARRADRPLSLSLKDGVITLQDAAPRLSSTIPIHDVDAATVWYRRHHEGWEVTVAMAREQGVCFAITLHLGQGDFHPHPHDIDVDLWDSLVGGVASLIRSVAPPSARVRQVFTSLELLDLLRESCPDSAWKISWFRGWRGVEPDLDLMGFHTGPHDQFWRLSDGLLHGPDVSTPLSLAIGSAFRRTTLIQPSSDGPVEREGELTLKILRLHDRVAVAFPCALSSIDEAPVPGATLHTHVTEALVILEQLRLHHPELLDDLWPEVRGALTHRPA